MAEEAFAERTEQATPKRREKAREDGQVARSMDLNAAAVILLGFTALFVLGPHMASQTLAMMRNTMANAPTLALSDPTFAKSFGDAMLSFFWIVLPVMVAMLVIGVGVNVAQVGFQISPKALQLKFDKFDVAKGIRRIFSMQSLVYMLRDTLKLVVIGFVAYKAIKAETDTFFLLPDMSVEQLAITMGKLSLIISLKIGGAILVIAILDYAWQRFQFEKSIRMSKQELKDEYRESEGSPQIKARVRQIQREMVRKRMMAAVPQADVIITNPTHLAVALKYDPNSMAAPFVIAKGERLIAQRIKEIAYQHNIPVIEDKPLARALFKLCDIGQMVPASLFRAVAEVLAYVYKLNGKEVPKS